MTRVVSVTSGKGGVGKTLTTIHMAIAARSQGQRVMILDADMGLANVDIVLGLQAQYNINDVIHGHASLKDIVLEGPQGIKVIPSGSGISALTKLTPIQRLQITEALRSFQDDVDLMIIDTGAGISDSVMYFNAAAQETIVVTTPEPHALTDAYAMIKVLHQEHRKNKVRLLINMAKSQAEALQVFHRIAEVANRFLEVDVSLLGYIPHDPQVQASVLRREIGHPQSINTIAGQAWNEIGRTLFPSGPLPSTETSSLIEVWQDLLWQGQDQSAGITVR